MTVVGIAIDLLYNYIICQSIINTNKHYGNYDTDR